MSVSDDYGKDFFEMHVQWAHDYKLMAKILADKLTFNSVADLGCGNGFLIQALERLGKAVIGVDGSEHALEYYEKVQVADLTQPLVIGKHDLVICTEVGEHMPKEFAGMLVMNIIRASKGLVFFSAAPPGSGGFLHINEQAKSYWVELFAAFGFERDEMTGFAICAELAKLKHTTWFAGNAMVFRRRG